ncbi:MAG: Efflux ABC transporter, ATP-binding protein [uncultured Thermomicrobiales bacterium]|uniref:Efflux ABC transporter, ATP-binding protein n=1 Tax=uncultured Thermomicrobiales bacterium TaxID=1645740 RepID=A0A6J4VU13_9BACT|nr:MAG: Efflux ABC transporter, ATP-binding protein [uncultured Thermomicrobiales bacterium]
MIEARGLTRRFGQFVAVEGVSLRVPDGAILALLGPNGAGKTTTVRMLAGLLAPSDGAATVAGCDVRRDPAGVRARVGLVTDLPGLYEQMTLPDYLDFFGGIYGIEPATRARRIAELIDFFELGEHWQGRLAGFSKGMKQKVALARALLHEPAALFLDEPTSGLDPLGARAVRELIVGLKAANRAIILCTHDLDEAERLADEVAIVRRGRIVASDAPAALRAAATTDTLVRIELAAPHPGARAALDGLPGATFAAPLGDGMSSLIEYRTARPRETNPLAIARLTTVGAAIVTVTCATRTLEEVYAAALNE